MRDTAHSHQQRVKQAFDRKVRKKEFEIRDLVLKWDAPRQDKGKHSKFDALWIGPFRISEVEGEEVFNNPVNGNFLKKCFV